MRGKKCNPPTRLQGFNFNLTTKNINKHKRRENIEYIVQFSVQRTYNMDYALKLPDVDRYNDQGWRK